MASKRLREPGRNAKPGVVDAEAQFWMMKFVPAFERAMLDESVELPRPSTISDLHDATIRAMLRTLMDSGMTPETFVEQVGQAFADLQPNETKWTPQLNKRRLALIDRQIQHSISLDEKLELARLTATMRQHVDSEENLPMQGARALHKKLLESSEKDPKH